MKLLVGSLLALSAVNAVGANMHIYKDKSGKVLQVNVSPSGSFDKPAKATANKVTYLSAAELKRLNAELDAEMQALKDDLKIAKGKLAEQNLKNTQKERKRKKGVLTASDSEEIFTLPMDYRDSVDIGAKIGMTKEQVLNKTHWGKPEHIHEVIDEYGKLESWAYSDDRGTQYLYFNNNKLIRIFGRR